MCRFQHLRKGTVRIKSVEEGKQKKEKIWKVDKKEISSNGLEIVWEYLI